MVTISRRDTGAVLGTIGEADLRILVDRFEEEGPGDRDYWVCEDTVRLLEDAGASPAFAAMLRAAIAGGDGVDIAWSPAG